VANPNDFWWLHDTSNNSIDGETRADKMKDSLQQDAALKLGSEKHLPDSKKHSTVEVLGHVLYFNEAHDIIVLKFTVTHCLPTLLVAYFMVN